MAFLRRGSKEFRGERPVIFLHIPKVAGSTLNYVMNRNYEFDEIFQHDREEDTHKGSVYTRTLEDLSQYQVIRGHFPLNWVLKTWPEKIPFCMTILRDPVKRVISHYHYIRRLKDHRQHSLAINGFESFLESDGVQVDNLQVRMLSGEDPWSQPKGACPGEWLDAARMNIRERIALVGVIECFDDFLVQAEDAVGWPARVYWRTNVTPPSREDDTIDDSLKERIRSMNRMDEALYREAKLLQQQALDSLPDNMKARLTRLKRVRRVISRFEKYWLLDAAAQKVMALRATMRRRGV